MLKIKSTGHSVARGDLISLCDSTILEITPSNGPVQCMTHALMRYIRERPPVTKVSHPEHRRVSHYNLYQDEVPISTSQL